MTFLRSGALPEKKFTAWLKAVRNFQDLDHSTSRRRVAIFPAPRWLLRERGFPKRWIDTIFPVARAFPEDLGEAGFHGPRGESSLQFLSVVIPVYGAGDLVRACVASLVSFPPAAEMEIILVDDRSPDSHTREVLRGMAGIPGVRLFEQEANRGFASSCNLGYREAKSEFVLFLNSDTEVLENWSAPLLASMDDPGVGASGSLLLYPGGRLVQHGGVHLLKEGGSLRPFHRGHFWRVEDFETLAEVEDVQAVTGACLLVRRGAVRDGKVFDEAYRNGYEDLDFCLDLGARGWKVRFCPASRVVHHESISTGRFADEERNRSFFSRRWGAVVPRLESERARLEMADVRARRDYLLNPCPTTAARALRFAALLHPGEVEAWNDLARGRWVPWRRIESSRISELHRQLGLDTVRVRVR